ncbi:hypothetical protein CHH88_03185 [Bacillus subtilis]|uniref:DUF4145 domain-containing protein n=1 Tax=Bacillus subtilis TaxID=1423 RepID=UPI000BA59F33|nr:DUF4145 domain-containing protein [Bacillus subtilis]PAE61509.1 hypothetical protein CHH88_03185 [Bacillus subtilis]
MSWLEFFSSIFNSWPLAVVIIVLALRKGLLSKLRKLLNLKFKDLLEVNFQEEMQKAEEALNAGIGNLSGNITIHTAKMDNNPELQSMKNIAKESPDAAIIASWLNVERAINDLVLEIDPGILNKVFYEKLKHIVQGNFINDNLAGTINHLRKIRNNVAHLKESLSYNDALNYYELCESVIEQIELVDKPQAS